MPSNLPFRKLVAQLGALFQLAFVPLMLRYEKAGKPEPRVDRVSWEDTQ